MTRRHPLYLLLPTLVREARAMRLDLRPLADDDLAALVAARYRLAEADAARLAAHLRDHAEGNPFYTGELLRTLEDAGLLHSADNRWHLGNLRGVSLPPLLRQVIDVRLARLGEEAVRLLSVAAVIGQVVPHDLWTAVSEAPEDALLDVIERAAEARVLVESRGDGGYRFAHALIREVLYEGLMLPRRRAWHRRSGAVLSASVTPDPDAVAYHFQQAGDARAVEWLIIAGERAWRSYAWLTAAIRYEAALALSDDTANRAWQAGIVATLGQLYRYTDPARGRILLEQATQMAIAAGNQALAAACQFDQGHLYCLWPVQDLRRGLPLMTAALPVLEALSDAERARLPTFQLMRVSSGEQYHREALMMQLANAGRFAEVRDLGEVIGAHASVPISRGRMALALAHASMGQPEVAQRDYAAVRAAFLATDQYVEAWKSLWYEMHSTTWPYYADRPERGHQLAMQADEIALRARETNPELVNGGAVLAFMLTWGQWSEAHRRLLLAPDSASAVLSYLWQQRGERDLAWEAVHRALPEGPSVEPGTRQILVTMPIVCQATRLALEEADAATAFGWLECHDRWLAFSTSVLWRADGQLGWANYHRAVGSHSLAHEYAERALACASAPRQPLALLAAHRLLGELATERSDHADAADHLAQALALAEACAAPYERALTLLARAELHAAMGDRAAALADLAEVRGILEPLAARPALARAWALAARLDAAP